MAFNDAGPQAPVHFLVIPKKPIATLDDVADEDEQVCIVFPTAIFSMAPRHALLSSALKKKKNKKKDFIC